MKRKPGSKPGTEAARTAFLFGNGDGERVLEVQRLAEIGGVAVTTIRNNLPEWEREFAAIVSGNTAIGVSIDLSPETLEVHLFNLDSFRALDAELEQEIRDLPKLTKQIRGMIDWFRDHGTKGDVMEVKALVESYLRLHGSRKSAIKQRLEVNARWNKLSGIEHLMDAAGARAKALETGRAKLELDKERAKEGLVDAKPASPIANFKGRQYVRKEAAAEVYPDDD